MVKQLAPFCISLESVAIPHWTLKQEMTRKRVAQKIRAFKRETRNGACFYRAEAHRFFFFPTPCSVWVYMGTCGPFSWYADDIHVHRSMKSSSFFRLCVCVCVFLRNYYCQQYAHADLTNLVQYSRVFEKKKKTHAREASEVHQRFVGELIWRFDGAFLLVTSFCKSVRKNRNRHKTKKKKRGGLRN